MAGGVQAAGWTCVCWSPGRVVHLRPCPCPLVQDVVNTHPGLAFLKEASEFHSRYITTVSTAWALLPGWVGAAALQALRPQHESGSGVREPGRPHHGPLGQAAATAAAMAGRCRPENPCLAPGQGGMEGTWA